MKSIRPLSKKDFAYAILKTEKQGTSAASYRYNKERNM